MSNPKKYNFLLILFCLIPIRAIAGDLHSYSGEYTEARTQTTCGARIHIEFLDDNFMIETEKCVSGGSEKLVGAFLCNAASMICTVNTNFEQKICMQDTLTLLSDGNIILTNPCSGLEHKWTRINPELEVF